MGGRRKQFKIYGPARFRATWNKFLEIAQRDGQSASELIRVWVEGYVQQKDPGNPQRPITGWIPGHEDEQALRFQELVSKLEGIASRRGGEVTRWMILSELEPLFKGAARARAADRLSRALTRNGVRVVR